MSTLATIRRNILSLSLLSAVEKVAGFLLIVLVARYLGKEVYGQYAFAVAFTSLFVIFADFGLNTFAIRDVAQNKQLGGKYLRNCLVLKLVFSVVIIGVIVASLNILHYPYKMKIIISLVGIITLLNMMTNLFISIIRAHQKMHYEAIAGFINRFIAVSGGITVLFLNYGLLELILVFLVAAIFQFIYVSFLVHFKFAKFELKFDPYFSKNLLKKSYPFLLFNLMMAINYKIDSVLLSGIKGDASVGIYNVAYNLIFSLMIVQSIVGRVMYPLFSEICFSDRDKFIKAYQQTIKFLLILAIPIPIMVTIFGDNIVLFLYGREFSESINVLKILIWSIIFMYSSYTLGVVLLAIGGEKKALFSWILCASVNLILNLIFIPKFSYIGASFTTLFSELIIFLSFAYFVTHKYKFPIFESAYILKLALLGLVLGVGLFYLQSLNLLLLISLFTAIYLLVLYKAKIFSLDDISTLKRIVAL